MSIKIREAFASDYSALNNLVLEVHSLHVKNRPDVYLDVDTPLMREYFEELLNTDDTRLFVVEDTDSKELVAYSTVKITAVRNIQILIPSRFAYIDDFCVKATHRKKGIGRALFQHVVDYAEAEGASSVHLTVWEFNKDAIEFYEAMGMSTMNRRMELRI